MSFKLHWDDLEETTLVVTYPSEWTWEQLYDIEDAGRAMIPEGDTQRGVALIQDMRAFNGLPSNAVPHLRNLVRRMHPNTQIVAFVGMSPFVRLMWQTFEKVTPSGLMKRRFVMVEDMDAARAAIRAHLKR